MKNVGKRRVQADYCDDAFGSTEITAKRTELEYSTRFNIYLCMLFTDMIHRDFSAMAATAPLR